MKRYLAALAIGGAVFGTVLASAASLGVITDGKLGSSEASVASCQNGLTSNYVVSWDGSATSPSNTVTNRYEVTGVRVNDLNVACEGKRIGIVLTAAGVKVAENALTDVVADVDGTTPAPSQTFNVSLATGNPSAAEVDGVRITIYGQ